MKKYKIIFFALFSVIIFSPTVARNNVNPSIEQNLDIDSLIASKNYMFNVAHLPIGNFASGYYYLKVINDSISVNLPYIDISNGNGNSNRANYINDQSGIVLNTKNFSYSAVHSKKGSYVIKIEVKNDPTTESFLLNINKKGYITLTVNSYNRNPISLYGPISENQ